MHDMPDGNRLHLGENGVAINNRPTANTIVYIKSQRAHKM